MKDTVTPHLLRSFMHGQLDTSEFSIVFVRQLEAIQRRMMRQQQRWHKRETKARQYREAALAGGGKRERERRLSQMERKTNV